MNLDLQAPGQFPAGAKEGDINGKSENYED